MVSVSLGQPHARRAGAAHTPVNRGMSWLRGAIGSSAMGGILVVSISTIGLLLAVILSTLVQLAAAAQLFAALVTSTPPLLLAALLGAPALCVVLKDSDARSSRRACARSRDARSRRRTRCSARAAATRGALALG